MRDPLIQALERRQRNDPLYRALDGMDRKRSGKGAAPTGSYLTEVLYVVGLGVLYAALYAFVYRDLLVTGVSETILVVALASRRRSRRLLARPLAASRVRRRWHAAVHDCGFSYPVRIRRVEQVVGGWRLRVRVGKGISVPDLIARTERLAAAQRVREVRIRRDPDDASLGTVTLVRELTGPELATDAWPDLDRHEDSDLWSPIPVGIDEHGLEVTISLPYRHLLIGGAPDSGKSVSLSMPLARAALDPNALLYLIDGKQVEFSVWEGVAEGFAYTMDAAITQLAQLQAAMDDRYSDLAARNLRKITYESGLPFVAIFVDELALFTNSADRRRSAEFTLRLTDIVGRGRGAGFIVCAATQKPHGAVVDTNLRDLFSYKWAMRCETPEASDTILGHTYASQGFNAATIPPSLPGLGYLRAEDGVPARLRSHYLTDYHLHALARRAHERRGVAA